MTSFEDEVTSPDLWMLAGHLTNAHNTAKANKQAVRYSFSNVNLKINFEFLNIKAKKFFSNLTLIES